MLTQCQKCKNLRMVDGIAMCGDADIISRKKCGDFDQVENDDWKSHKICSTCRRILPVGMFSKDARKGDGLNCSCKECDKQRYMSMPIETAERYYSNRSRRIIEDPEYASKLRKYYRDYYRTHYKKKCK